MRPLEGRVAAVLGATRGIGKGIAVELGAAGAEVYVAGRTLDSRPERPGSVSETVEEIEQLGGRAVPVRCDATDDASLAELFSAIRAQHGELHVLVNSVFDAGAFGSTIGKRFWELPVSAWHDIVDVGTRSAYVASVHAADLLIAAGASDPALVVNVSARGAARYRYNVAYGVGKAALDKLTADLAVDLADSGVAAVSLWPNMTRTERVDAAVAAGDSQLYEEFGGADSLETPRYNGRVVVALMADPELMLRSGKRFWTAELGQSFGVVDENGRSHDPPEPVLETDGQIARPAP